MMAAYILTRIQVGDYDTWRPMFDQDRPRAREAATSCRVFRGTADPGEVTILIEYASQDDAETARRRLLESGVLDRFADRTDPTVFEET
jgi:hypothetical protein